MRKIEVKMYKKINSKSMVKTGEQKKGKNRNKGKKEA